MTVLAPDLLPDLKSWLKNHPDLAPLHGGRVFFRMPEQLSAYPAMRIYRIGGGFEDYYTSWSQFRVGIHVHGKDSTDYNKVRQLAVATESALWQIEAGRLIPGGQTYCSDGIAQGVLDLPDPATGAPRYVLSAVLHCRLAGDRDP